ncbi:MAG: domain containing protein [Ignavibacteria bacterium]|nr:domain containing protein [Ignavibacteria bacterium]
MKISKSKSLNNSSIEIEEKQQLRTDEFLIENLNNCWNFVKVNLVRCRAKFEENPVHNLRVSIRRLLAFLELARGVVNSKDLSRLSKSTKKILKLFNGLRDTQVQLLSIDDLRLTHPVLSEYYFELKTAEQLYISSIKEQLMLVDLLTLEGFIFFLKFAIKNNPILNSIPLERLSEPILANYHIILERISQVKREEPDTIHKVRLAFKNFRYMLEIMQPVINLPKEKLRLIKNFQTTMGNIQDCTVFLDGLTSHIFTSNSIPAIAYNTIIEEIISNRSRLIDEFIEICYNPEFFKNNFLLPAY